MLALLVTVALFGFIIFCHEFGHLVASAIVGAPVREFSLGFGPVLWKRDVSVGRIQEPVTLSVRALPLGGYVRFRSDSENKGEQGEPERTATQGDPPVVGGTAWEKVKELLKGNGPLPDPFRRIPPMSKIFIAFAGPAGSIFAMFVLYACALMAWGNPPSSELPDRRIGVFQMFEPSLAAALQATDDPSLVTRAVTGGEPTPLTSPDANWERLSPARAATHAFVATKQATTIISDMMIWLLKSPTMILESVSGPVGMVDWGTRAASTSVSLPKDEQRRLVLLRSPETVTAPPSVTVVATGEEGAEGEGSMKSEPSEPAADDATPSSPSTMIPGDEPEGTDSTTVRDSGEEGEAEGGASPDEIAGQEEDMATEHEPSVIATSGGRPILQVWIPRSEETRGFALLFLYMGALSVLLAVVNLLPLPPLDGFQAAVGVMELVSRRRLSSMWRAYLSMAGAALLLGLLALGTLNDVGRLMEKKDPSTERPAQEFPAPQRDTRGR